MTDHPKWDFKAEWVKRVSDKLQAFSENAVVLQDHHLTVLEDAYDLVWQKWRLDEEKMLAELKAMRETMLQNHREVREMQGVLASIALLAKAASE